jgi:ABC-type nickel/cobalt efflux system permease component RcnA
VHWLLFLAVAFAWIAFCLFGIHWKKASAALTEGAWIPLALLLVFTALLWSQFAPSELSVWGFFNLPNFLWQLVAILTVVGVGLFCGWVQFRYHWFPQDVPVGPPEHGHGHADHHDAHHGHDGHSEAAHGHHEAAHH